MPGYTGYVIANKMLALITQVERLTNEVRQPAVCPDCQQSTCIGRPGQVVDQMKTRIYVDPWFSVVKFVLHY